MVQNAISMAEAAELAGLSISHMGYLARTNRLEARKIGRDWVTTKDAVERYVNDEAAPPASRRGYYSCPAADDLGAQSLVAYLWAI